MLTTNFKYAWRNLKRSKAFSLINITGLSLGIASSIVIFLVVQYQLNYDRFNHKGDRIYRVTTKSSDFNANVSMAVVPAIRSAFPEIEHVSQVLGQPVGLITVGRQKFSEKNYAYVDADFTSMFDYRWLEGDQTTALKEPNSIVLTKSLERKYFGDSKALGKLLSLDNQHVLNVTGVIEDFPGNTQLPFSFLVSFETVRKDLQTQGAMSVFYWINGGSFAYVLLPKELSMEAIQSRMPSFVQKTWGADIARNSSLLLQPLFEVSFDTRYINNIIVPTSRNVYFSLLGVAVLIIVVACINFINLTTAQAVKRAKEMAVRKILGSGRRELIIQLLLETSILILVATLAGVALVAAGFSFISQSLDISLDPGQMLTPQFAVWFVLFLVVLLALAGIYPAFVQSAFSPVRSLAGKLMEARSRSNLRKGFVVVQFAMSQVMIIGTLVIAFQMDFLQNKDLGYDKDAIVSFEIPDNSKKSVVSQQLAGVPGVKGICFSSAPPAYDNNYTNVNFPGMSEGKDEVTEIKSVDEHYTSLFKLRMLAGVPVQINNHTDKDTLFDIVINQTLLRKLGIGDPESALGKQLHFNGSWLGTVTGVVQDFQNGSRKNKISPCILMYRATDLHVASVKLSQANLTSTLSSIDKDWSSLFPDQVFQYEFMDNYISSLYKQERKQYIIFRFFAIIAVVIGSIGLYGLVRFTAVQRVKEVGIRKVLGASVTGIIRLFTGDFVRMICIAFLFAAPIAYYIMSHWLQNFAYQISIGPKFFLMAGASSVLIALSSILFHLIRAARSNPALSLRSE